MEKSDQLYLIFLWHMHQPYYRDPLTGVYRLPWVRLHATKDYYDMPAILEGFPGVRQTFNLVPSLLEQLEEYASGIADDHFLSLSLKEPPDISETEKQFILENFFMANWDNMVRLFPRYRELLEKRGLHPSPKDLKRAARRFTDQDILDLQVWFNLAWFDPMFHAGEEILRELIEKGRDFTEDEKTALIDKQREVISRIVPKYRSLEESGQIEISSTPYFHPILPLVWDTDRMAECMPQSPRPTRFRHPEDAKEQVRRAVAYHERAFGKAPKGMWPSEGSVSQEILPVFAENGISWIASDEGVLASSIGRALRDSSGHLHVPGELYQPYRLSNGLQIIFRDHAVSDLIGFEYHRMKPKAAVDNFISTLKAIHRSLPRDRAYAVPVILDGENAWEWYSNDGRDFLLPLYERLSREGFVKCATVSEYLAEHPAERNLEYLRAGSWINADFGIWIGHEEDRAAWELLRKTRDDMEKFLATESFDDEQVEEARRAVFAAEGSDWCWWYGDEHATDTQAEFDELFRHNLIHVYRALGKEPPPELHFPVLREDRVSRVDVQPRGFIRPVLDGQVTSYFEWLAAGMAEIGTGGGAMHRAERIVSRIYFGFDQKMLYLRLDGGSPFTELEQGPFTFEIHFLKPVRLKAEVTREEDGTNALLLDVNGNMPPEELESEIGEVLELGVSFYSLGAKPRDEIFLYVAVSSQGAEVERWPQRGMMRVQVPTEDFEAEMWS